MKTLTLVLLIGFLLILTLTPPTSAQFKEVDFSSGGVSMTIPDNWVVSEHVLLLLMPKPGDLTIEAELMNTVDLSEAIELSAIELKSVFPQDTSFFVNDIVVNKMPVKKIDKVSESEELIFYIIKTPEDKIIRLKCISDKATIAKYKGDMSKIFQSIKSN